MQIRRQPIGYTPTFNEEEDLKGIRKNIANSSGINPIYMTLLWGGNNTHIKEPKIGYDIVLEMVLFDEYPDIKVEWREQGEELTKVFSDYYLGIK